MADTAESDKLKRQMEKHAEHMEAFIQKICSLANLISEAKYKQIRAFLVEPQIDLTEFGLPCRQISKFKWHVKKKK